MFLKKIIFILFLLFYYKWKIYKNQINEIINHKNNIYDINYLKNLKKVVYTALLGKYDNIQSIVKEIGYDYFMFTDLNFENQTNLNWTILKIDEELKVLNINIIKRQRFFKTHPHLFFKSYDLSIYIDSTFEIKGKLDEFLIRILTPKLSIYILEHPYRNTINNEFKAVVEFHKDSNKTVIPIQNKYNNENFPDNNGLAECCLIIRKHNQINCINFMNKWFNEIEVNSHRDQLSFNYILWKSDNKNVKYISKNSLGDYFNQNPIHLLSFEFKDN